MRSQRWYTPWLLVAAPVIWVLVFSIWPFVNTVILSFTNKKALKPGEFVGLTNYRRLFNDDLFDYAIVNTGVYVLVCVPLLTILPLLIALLLRNKVPGLTLFRTTSYFPVVASAVVVALIWTWMFDSRGVINEALKYTGMIDRPLPFLTERWWVIGVAISLTVWKGLGYYTVVYLAALGSIDQSLHEAAALDGAGAVRRFVHVTVPGVRNAIFIVSALIAVSAMRIFTELHILTNGTGGPGGEAVSLVMMVRQVGSGLRGETGYASAISVVLFCLTLVPLAALAWVNNRNGENAA